MEKVLWERVKVGFISLSTLALLAACGNNGSDQSSEDQPEDQQEEQLPEEDTNEAEEKSDDKTNEETTDEETTASDGVLSMKFSVSFDDAVKQFHDTFGADINIDEIEFDNDRDTYYYNIQGWDEENDYELEIDANSGDVREESVEKDTDQDDILELDQYITPTEAMQKAIDASDTDVVDEWSLEFENGRPIYDIEMTGAEDVEVDAETGDIL